MRSTKIFILDVLLSTEIHLKFGKFSKRGGCFLTIKKWAAEFKLDHISWWSTPKKTTDEKVTIAIMDDRRSKGYEKSKAVVSQKQGYCVFYIRIYFNALCKLDAH